MMSENDGQDIEALRRDGVSAFKHLNLSESRRLFERLLLIAPSDAVALLHLSLILQASNDPANALDLLKQSTKLDPNYAVSKGTGIYLSRRLRVREGAAFEDGWISFLDVALLSGIIPQHTLEELALLPTPDGSGTGRSRPERSPC